MLLQVDGSQHDWLEGRGPYLTLVAAIDDATGSVAGAVFREEEDAQGYFLMLREVISSKGVPLALYSDRHGIFQRSIKEPETWRNNYPGTSADPIRPVTERTGDSGDIGPVDPGEREDRAAHGTLQDRLVAELRLAGAATMEMANRTLQDFLPGFNERFGVPASQPGTAYRRPSGMDPASVLCFKYTALWPRTTPYDLPVAHYNCCPGWNAQAMLTPGWRCRKSVKRPSPKRPR